MTVETASRPRPGPPTAPAAAGREMHDLAAELYPICRSITGNGVRETLARGFGFARPLRVLGN